MKENGRGCWNRMKGNRRGCWSRKDEGLNTFTGYLCYFERAQQTRVHTSCYRSLPLPTYYPKYTDKGAQQMPPRNGVHPSSKSYNERQGPKKPRSAEALNTWRYSMLDTLIQTPMNEHIAHDHVKNPTVFFLACARCLRARAE